MRRFLRVEWHAVAGALAAVVALALHLLHVIDQDVVLAVMLVLLALLMVGGLRTESREERIVESVSATADRLEDVRRMLAAPDVILVGPRELRSASEEFARRARGEMTWFNVCLTMFIPQALFDAMLRPAIENPAVTGIRFVLDESERSTWERSVLPKVRACVGAEKVRAPVWGSIGKTVSFVLAGNEEGSTEGHLSFWGEPFMARSTGRDIPRYVFHVLGHSDLIGRLIDIERAHGQGPTPG